MPLEQPTNFIDQLNSANPVGNVDSLDEADNHLRATKQAVQGSFPNLGLEAVTLTAAEINKLIIDIAANVVAIEENAIAVAPKIEADNYATSSVGGTAKMRVSGTDLFITINGTDA